LPVVIVAPILPRSAGRDAGMTKGRLEAFSDGVLAIVITIMVLEMKSPHDPRWQTLMGLWPVFISYVLSFIYIGIYWNNHHHMLHAVKQVNGGVLWANMHLLFWLSLIPFTTGWMGETHFAEWPVRLYGVNLLACAGAYTILVRALVGANGQDSTIAKAVGSDRKGNVSLLLYLCGIAGTFLHPWLGYLAYVTVAAIWLVPDRRMERALLGEHAQ
jgi:uncharacterized membrane protein